MLSRKRTAFATLCASPLSALNFPYFWSHKFAILSSSPCRGSGLFSTCLPPGILEPIVVWFVIAGSVSPAWDG